MKNKFKYNYGKAMLVFLWMLLACWLVIFAINFLRVFNLLGFASRDMIQEITSIVFAVLFFVVWIWLITLGYKITDDKVTLMFGPFDLTKKQFFISKTVKIIESSDEKKLYLNVYVKENPQIVLININPKNFDDFVATMKSKNEKIYFDKADIN